MRRAQPGWGLAARSRPPAAPSQPPAGLLARARWLLRVRHYSPRSERSYVNWIRRYVAFLAGRHPREAGEVEVTAFLTGLATQHRVSASTQNQALAALLFLYRDLLGHELPWLDRVVRAKRPARLPVVLSRRAGFKKGQRKVVENWRVGRRRDHWRA